MPSNEKKGQMQKNSSPPQPQRDKTFMAPSDSELLEAMETEGFVFLPNFLNGEALTELNAHVDRFIRHIVPTLQPEQVFCEDKSNPETLKQIQNMNAHDLWFHDLFTNSRFQELAEVLLKGPVVPKNMQYFNKPPGVGQPTPPHQDGYYFMLNPCEAITMWFALDVVDEENGCVRYVPGSHRHGMREHSRTQTLGFSQGITDYPTDQDRKGEVTCPAKPGDLLVHDALTIHRADANRSCTRSRRALGFIYYSQRAREDREAHTMYQRRLAEDLKSKGKI
jgi:phytanoyl-CoA hydroxylase